MVRILLEILSAPWLVFYMRHHALCARAYQEFVQEKLTPRRAPELVVGTVKLVLPNLEYGI